MGDLPDIVLGPRATVAAGWPRWKPVLIANALTSGTFVLSVNRPAPEFDVPIGGPSFAVAPWGEVLAESTARIVTVTLDRARLDESRVAYPGYLDVRADLYGPAWSSIAEPSA